MQLASYGTRAIPARYISRLVSKNLALSHSIHIPLPRPALPPPTTAGTAQKLVNQTCTLLTRFFTHLTAPGLRAPPSSFPNPARSLHTAVPRPGIQSIYANLSLPARHALSRGPFLPRAPPVPRGMTQVGLGTARNFSSARPIFQNLVQNVPVAGRAFFEADWDLRGVGKDDGLSLMRKENYKGKYKEGKIGEMAKSNDTQCPLFTVQPDVQVASECAFESDSDLQREHYFPTMAPSSATEPTLTTYLLIPLAPTPTSRLPLPTSFTHTSRPLLPLSHLASIHHSHSTHALRVSSLFARLDAGEVWDKGVACDAYSSAGTSKEGLCTVLRVSFTGWSAAEVRSVIGESGTGWCELYEVCADEAESDSEFSSDLTDYYAFGGNEGVSGMSESSWAGDDILSQASDDGSASVADPSYSFILPTLDFSSSFLESSSTTAPLSPSSSWVGDVNVFAFPSSASNSSISDSDSDSSSCISSTFSLHDSGSPSVESWVQQQPSHHASSRFGFGFSSEFSARLGSDVDCGEGPQEVMF